MNDPLVSVCIGVYNRERHIRECLESVLGQTYRDLEIVVVDNASTDRTAEVVQGYGDRVRLIRREVNSGMCSTTRNEAVRQARGPLIAFLDSDDRWEPAKIEKQVRFLDDHPSIPLCHAYCREMDGRSEPGRIRHEGVVPPTGRCFDALLDHCWITISTVLMRRWLYDECGPFQEALPYGHMGEDYEFFLKVARRHEIGFLPEVLAHYRKEGAGISGGDWRGNPDAFPFFECLRERGDLWQGMVTARRMDEVLRRSARDSSQFWRDQGQGWRAAYFPWRMIRRRPWTSWAWTDLAKSLSRAGLPRGWWSDRGGAK